MDNSKVEIKETNKYGKGIFAKEYIKKGEVIGEHDGSEYDYDYPHWTKELEDHAIQFEKRKWKDCKEGGWAVL